jgi:LysM repeat protein
MAARKPARYLAPVAVLGVAAAIGLVVKSHVNGTGGAGATTGATAPTGALVHSTRLPTKRTVHKFYRVKPGNTLSGIAQKTGVPIATIERLNPNVNASALQNGQRLRLRR